MEEAIQLLVSGRDRSGVLELNLDNRFKGAKGAGAGTGRSPLAGFTRLATLSMNNVGLASLDGLFPSLAALRELELNDNRLTGGLEHLNRLSGLESLKLAGNQIATVEALKPLAKLRSLTSLDMIENPVTRQAGYRERVFAALPGLVVLDGVDREGNEVEMDDDDEEDDEDEEDDGEDEEGDTYRKIMAKPYGGPAVGRGEAKGVAGEGERDQGDDVDDEDMDDEEEDVEDEDDDPAVGDEEEEADDEEDYGEGGEDDDEEYGYDREGQGAQQRQVNEGEEEEDDGEDDDEDVEGGEYGEEDYEDDDEDVEDDITGQEVGKRKSSCPPMNQ